MHIINTHSQYAANPTQKTNYSLNNPTTSTIKQQLDSTPDRHLDWQWDLVLDLDHQSAYDEIRSRSTRGLGHTNKWTNPNGTTNNFAQETPLQPANLQWSHNINIKINTIDSNGANRNSDYHYEKRKHERRRKRGAEAERAPAPALSLVEYSNSSGLILACPTSGSWPAAGGSHLISTSWRQLIDSEDEGNEMKSGSNASREAGQIDQRISSHSCPSRSIFGASRELELPTSGLPDSMGRFVRPTDGALVIAPFDGTLKRFNYATSYRCCQEAGSLVGCSGPIRTRAGE